MRLLITLQFLKDCAYNTFYDKFRGFVYSLQQESSAFNQHDVRGYKLFTFSNVYRVGDIKAGDERYFQISSPSNDFIYYIRGQLAEKEQVKKIISVGEYQFKIISVKSLQPKIEASCELITGTPIVIRIPNYNYGEYGIKSERPFEYWRPEHDFNIFIKQLTDNLLKKYDQHYHKKPESKNLFEQFEFKKSVSVVKVENGENIPVVGSVWKFGFSHLNHEQQTILQLGLDAGFGEMNSSGFGFMNKVEG